MDKASNYAVAVKTVEKPAEIAILNIRAGTS